MNVVYKNHVISFAIDKFTGVFIFVLYRELVYMWAMQSLRIQGKVLEWEA